MMESENYWQDNHENMSKRIEHIFHKKLYTDFMVVIKDNGSITEFNVHKVFLASASPYFETFLFGLLSSQSNSMVIDDVDPTAFGALLSYIYTDEPSLCNISEAINLYHLADRYLMNNLKQICQHYILKTVDTKTVFQVLENLRMYNDELVTAACFNIIRFQTMPIILGKDFEEISKESVLMILNEDLLDIKSETQLYRAAERWLEAQVSKGGITDDSEIKELFYEIVENIRFRNIPADEFPRSAFFSKYMTPEDKQQIFDCLTCENDMPGNFSNKKRNYMQDIQGPVNPVKSSSNARQLRHDWKQCLYASVGRGDIKTLKRLISDGADVSVKYSNGTTLLHIAAHRCKNVKMVKCLLDHGIPVNTIDGSGYTALHLAALWGKLETIQLLLDLGADPSMTNTEGQTPLSIANAQRHQLNQEIRDLLMSRM